MTGAIRVKAIAIVRRGDAVLLSYAIDPDTGRRYGRFLGGAVEPGERASDALCREWREELGVDLTDLVQRGVVENIFQHDNRTHHEVIFVFSAALADRSLYDQRAFAVNEAISDGPAEWVSLDALRRAEIVIYPPELLELIEEAAVPSTPRPISPSNQA